MNKTLAYIIDLDGTLYDNSHRQHLIPADRSNTAGWVEFNCACTDDVMREDMADLVRSVLLSGREVIFLTGRGEAAGEQTMQRLLKDFNFIEQPTLIMRPMDCHTSAAEFKRDAVKRIRDSKRWAGYDLIALEDDPSIVEVMRGIGVTVLHIDSKCCTVEKPHHNGMMQLSNELASVKEALRRLSAFARSHAGDIQYTGDHPIAVAEKLAGQSFGNAEQLDTTPVQFESLAGDKSVSQPCNFPIEMTPEMMRAVQIGSELGAYAAANLSGAYGLFAEFWDVACRAAGNSPVTPDGWISCSEQMPSAGEQVLAYRPDAPESNDPLIKMATYVGRSAHGHGFDCYCKPTHWMPLPAAPRQDVQSALKHGLKRYAGAMQKMAKREGKS